MTSLLQQKVTEHVHKIAGITLQEIKVLVENVAVGIGSRIELR